MSEVAVHRIELPVSAEAARVTLEAAAEAWGAEWQSEENRLLLPLSAGLRHGVWVARVAIEPAAGGCEVRLTEEGQSWHLRANAVFVLVVAGLGALTTVLWPLFPSLLPLAPIGAVLALGAWFLVLSRLTTNTPDDFLRFLADSAQEPAAEE